MSREEPMCTLYVPRLEDMWFRQKMLADETTMFYNHAWGGVIDFPEERWKSWYACWAENTEGRRYYRYLKEQDEAFLGEVAYHYEADCGAYMANVILYAPYRGRGYGGRALDLLCAAAKENGIRVLYDDIASDNPALRLFLRHGFTEVCRTEEMILLKKEL